MQSKQIKILTILLCFCTFLFCGVLWAQSFFFSKAYFYKKQYKRHASNPAITYNVLNNLLKISTTKKNTFFSRKYNSHKTIHTLFIDHIQNYPEDINNGYYNLIIGKLYEKNNAILQATKYYEIAFDLPMSPLYKATKQLNSSTEALRRIITISKIPLQELHYNMITLEQHPDIIPKSILHYTIGELYYTIGMWNNAYASYQEFLKYPKKQLDTSYTKIIQNHENIYLKAKRRNNTFINRTWKSAEEARQAVLSALYTKSTWRIQNLRAPSFFTAQWEENILDSNVYIPTFRIDIIVQNSNIHPSEKFSDFSTQNIKFWKIVGWKTVSTWYFVFRKIQQPDMPHINGMWEWAGIYIGLANSTYTPL